MLTQEERKVLNKERTDGTASSLRLNGYKEEAFCKIHRGVSEMKQSYTSIGKNKCMSI